MNSLKGLFQRFCFDFQNNYFSENLELWKILNFLKLVEFMWSQYNRSLQQVLVGII